MANWLEIPDVSLAMRLLYWLGELTLREADQEEIELCELVQGISPTFRVFAEELNSARRFNPRVLEGELGLSSLLAIADGRSGDWGGYKCRKGNYVLSALEDEELAFVLILRWESHVGSNRPMHKIVLSAIAKLYECRTSKASLMHHQRPWALEDILAKARERKEYLRGHPHEHELHRRKTDQGLRRP